MTDSNKRYTVAVNNKLWIERPLYNIFFLNKNWYIVVPKINKCKGCCFYHNSVCHRSAFTEYNKYGRCGETTRSDGIGIMFKIINMENNQITIDIPKGMKIDVKNSDLSKGIIKFKSNSITIKDVYNSLAVLPYIHSYYDAVEKHTLNYDYMLILSKLLDIAQFYNGTWKPNWKDAEEIKYFIVYDGEEQHYSVGKVWSSNYSIVYFKNEKDAKEVIGNPNFRKILDTIYKNKQ